MKDLTVVTEPRRKEVHGLKKLSDHFHRHARQEGMTTADRGHGVVGVGGGFLSKSD